MISLTLQSSFRKSVLKFNSSQEIVLNFGTYEAIGCLATNPIRKKK